MNSLQPTTNFKKVISHSNMNFLKPVTCYKKFYMLLLTVEYRCFCFFVCKYPPPKEQIETTHQTKKFYNLKI